LLEFPSPATPNNNNLSFMPAHCVYNNCFERWEKEKWKMTQLRRLSVLPQQASFASFFLTTSHNTHKPPNMTRNDRTRERERGERER
jgi:hypothetical protein